MGKPTTRTDLRALKNLVAEAKNLLTTISLPEGRATRALELLTAADALADQLLKTPPAVQLGKKGGQKTAERGPDYYAKIAAMRKTRRGGRPRKKNEG